MTLRKTTTDILNLIRQNKTITALIVIMAVYFPWSWSYSTGWPDSMTSTSNSFRLVLITTLLILLVFNRYSHRQLFQAAHHLFVPLMAVGVMVLFVIAPFWADYITREDRLIEDWSFAFNAIGSLAMFAVFVILWRRDQRLPSITSLLLSFVFFVIAMEEVSWFQRHIGIETTEFFLEHNMQNEMNLHNLSTNFSEQVYYTGAFILLTVLPFFRDNMAKLLDYLNLASLKILLPQAWLILPFIITHAFVRLSNFTWVTTSITSLACMVILASLIITAYQQGKKVLLGHTIAVTILFLFTTGFFVTMNHSAIGVFAWIATEYREFFIAWGIAAYAISILYQLQEAPDKA